LTLTPVASSQFHEPDAIIINDSIFDHRLELITAGARPYLKEHLLHKISRENCSAIINYILAMQTETNLSESYRLDTIHKLKQLAEFHALEEENKVFRDMTRQDILDFLDRLRKPESVDPLHKRIGGSCSRFRSYRIDSIMCLLNRNIYNFKERIKF
jgi:hypothetical protein